MSRTLGLGINRASTVNKVIKSPNAPDDNTSVIDVQEIVATDQRPGSSNGFTSPNHGDQSKRKRVDEPLVKKKRPTSNYNIFGSALTGLSNKKDVKKLEMEITNLNNQIKSLRMNLRAELDLKGRLGKLMKAKEFKIAELQMRLDTTEKNLLGLEEEKTKAEITLVNNKERATYVINRMKEEMAEKEQRITSLELQLGNVKKDLRFAMTEISRTKSLETEINRAQIKLELDELKKKEDLARARRLNLVKLLGDGYLKTVQKNA